MMTSKNSKHSNQVRIIGGIHRGRKLNFQSAEGLRPTPDMVREKVFNWLGQDLAGKTVLDLFAGSGALGLEAASRRAARVMMVENNRQTVCALQNSSRELGTAQVEIIASDSLMYLQQQRGQFDVVFLDPPFAWQDWPRLFESLQSHLKNGAMVYIEASVIPTKPEWLEVYREGKSGMSKFEVLRYTQVAE
ncbi:16S rRNA (guanine(966)-N(2))-methyltransferase RsmD [Neisseria iguanae]|uniref:16S rRNA (Guanine(966)-N(2))-methyltransferase RsmD n=1 Tax=Neisseria iguanae TaxID=90242 RepID=A0A2P7TZK4_9NEIS|nr:16S rRNA (guanine(966)-N(2))-methyltransferase RsmD [Neisseria iguanae]PSJ80121.1 16S rRNA (guanine(966)-N(2))-methyltransferase RsmD [Neisseria iguanae]